MKIDSTTIIEEVLLKIRKTGRKNVSRKTILKNLGISLKYIIETIEQELKEEGIKIIQ